MSAIAEDQDFNAGLTICPACGSQSFSSFYQVRQSPTNANILFKSASEAEACPTGDIDLCFCDGCGLVFNKLFDPALSEYSDRYEATQGFSPTFSGFQSKLATGLIERHNLRGKTVLEIGSGHGDFLLLMSQLGECQGVGIDPAANPARISEFDGAERVTILPELYNQDHAHISADLLVCKMTLEHIQDAETFLSRIRRNLANSPETIVFFQVPESHRIFRDGAFEDIYYEHCTYFTPGSLGRLFRRCGFNVRNIERQYSDQYLIIEAVTALKEDTAPLEIEESIEVLANDIKSFKSQMKRVRQDWQNRIHQVVEAGGKVVIWGSGAKAVGFLSTVRRNADIRHVVDINPHKSNSFMPVSGQRIIAPAELAQIKPDLVIIMNPVYETEISQDIHKAGLSPDIVCL